MSTEPTGADSGDECTEVVAAFERLDFERWAGWPEGCGYAHVQARYPRADRYDALNARGRGGWFIANREHQVPGCRGGARVWFADDDIVLVELRYPELDVEALLEALGAADLVLDFAVSMGIVPGGARVYPSRGIAVFVDPPGPVAARIELFPATDVETYLEQLHIDETYGGWSEEPNEW